MKNLLFSLAVMIMTISLFGQENSIEDNRTMIMENFPGVYETIENGAVSEWSDDEDTQEITIIDQCFAFSEYIVFMNTDKLVIPKDTLKGIMEKALRKYSKNPIPEKACDELIDELQKLDCILSYMQADWVKVIIEIKEQIEVYKSVKKNT
jgi:hypothetical protein